MEVGANFALGIHSAFFSALLVRHAPARPSRHAPLMEDEEGAEDAEVRSIITSPDGPRPQQLRSGRDFWQLYEKGETLGRGHFAKVKLVRERSSGAFFAAKIVIKQHDDDLATESMAREFLMLHSLDHANVMHTPTHPATTPPGTIR